MHVWVGFVQQDNDTKHHSEPMFADLNNFLPNTAVVTLAPLQTGHQQYDKQLHAFEERNETLTTTWRNLRRFEKTHRPHDTDLTMLLKLSSRMTMSAASLATSVPAMPMARPTSDSLRAGASLVPSPVTATTSPCFFNSFTKSNLSFGELRASTYSIDVRCQQCGQAFLEHDFLCVCGVGRGGEGGVVFGGPGDLSHACQQTNRLLVTHLPAQSMHPRIGHELPLPTDSCRLCTLNQHTPVLA